MFEILKKEVLSQDMFLMDIYAPRIANSVLPGQFLIVKMKENSERIPLTVSDFDVQKGIVTIVFKAIGKSTDEMSKYEVGQSFCDVVGPLGRQSEFCNLPMDKLKNKHFVFIGGGVGIAPIYPQVKWLHDKGITVDCIIGAKTRSLLVYVEELRKVSNLYITTDDNTGDHQGLVTDMLKKLLDEGKKYDEVVAIGPMIMMKFVAQLAGKYEIPCVVSLNSLMVDGTGMCGACRVSVGGETKFTCVDGPEFDGSKVDFAEAMKRQAMYDNVVTKKILEDEEKAEGHQCHIGGISDETRDKKKRVPILEQDAKVRAANFDEVCLGYSAEEAMLEARRCLNCKNPQCVSGCPVYINIPGFIQKVAQGDFEEAARIINQDSALPAVCGRVCPQETQCEGRCILGKKFDPVAIGKLERFVGDWAREHDTVFEKPAVCNGHKVAVIGSGPSGITCAKELLMKGYDVTVFEALHEFGGVLVYGIPSFRLPKETVVKHEVDNIRRLGAHFEKDVVVGKTVSIDELMKKENFEAVFIGSGAGLPKFMNIPGENLCGVVSANEFLTRNNLLFAYKEGFDTPNFLGKKVAVVGGGNVAMDAARTALRLGAHVYVVYRRSEKELPARVEEVHHAKEEGVEFHLLCNPMEIIGDDKGWVKAVKCIRMELGEPDASGRRRPVEIKGSEFILDIDMLIMSLGTSPNPLLSATTPGLEVNKYNCLVADEETGQTTHKGVFAGGDAVSGAATVILAMGAGKKAAAAIDKYIQNGCK
ncbi:MAG: bifunctional dihydroorotate dehydrogenase B NAD binding subunit/NADPH-dependent glutamate synthase [Bacteroidales bacterium]|jgi:glutamate synthase (NADPH) small chain|nr:bifunctional dihydroorotate dehydrogenase B NAD binding subunit/NADPH-dependent glutamate synthase [Bacteroidales bacterium]MDD3914311.1 bifunctional dihydroorotate dehydrogenase B NAD binding subunit/NADPH-dependent glutamate synthase [Bacteroidales bacterium]MDD4634374.1 bifunctional dihydroorotate dehydrogenase B NAD binding subunit/NADPH-dependent glutamate synthase [Bacteroidales bacterium]